MKNRSNINTVLAITVVLCVCFLLSLFNSFFFFDRKSESITLPSVQTDSDKHSEYDNFFADNTEILSNKLELTPQNIGNVVKTLRRPDKYSFSVTKTLYYGEDFKTTQILVYVIGSYSKIEILNRDSSVYKNCIFGQDNVFIWQNGEKKYYRGAKGNFSADAEAQFQTYEDIVNMPPEQIKQVSYIFYEEIPCICVEATDPETNYSTKYWVSAENGLLIHSECYDSDGNTAYAVDIDNISSDNFSEDVFILPDGQVAYDVESYGSVENFS